MNYLLPVLVFAGLGAASGTLLTAASKIFEVKTDPRIDEINEALPQANCGGCGYSGCSDYARAIVEEGAPVNMCRPGGGEAAEKIASVMGVSAGAVTAMTAVVRCGGSCENTAEKYTYAGTQTCLSANRFYNGSKVCTHACLGFGDCVKACPQGAISVESGIAKVNHSLCVGCGLCAKACPNNIIVIRDISKKYDVRCSSTDIGKIVRSVCKSGCIGCKLCEKNCPSGAVKVTNNLAAIDYEKCTSCGKCESVCPAKAIKSCGS